MEIKEERKNIAEKFEGKLPQYLVDFFDEKELEQIEREEQYRLSRKDLSDVEQEVFDDLENGFDAKEIADRRQCSKVNVYGTITRIKKKGFIVNKAKKEEIS